MKKIIKTYGHPLLLLGIIWLVSLMLSGLIFHEIGLSNGETEGYIEGYKDGYYNSEFMFPVRGKSGVSFDKQNNTIIVNYDYHTFREIAFYICNRGWDVTVPYNIFVKNNTMLLDWSYYDGAIYYEEIR